MKNKLWGLVVILLFSACGEASNWAEERQQATSYAEKIGLANGEQGFKVVNYNFCYESIYYNGKEQTILLKEEFVKYGAGANHHRIQSSNFGKKVKTQALLDGKQLWELQADADKTYIHFDWDMLFLEAWEGDSLLNPQFYVTEVVSRYNGLESYKTYYNLETGEKLLSATTDILMITSPFGIRLLAYHAAAAHAGLPTGVEDSADRIVGVIYYASPKQMLQRILVREQFTAPTSHSPIFSFYAPDKDSSISSLIQKQESNNQQLNIQLDYLAEGQDIYLMQIHPSTDSLNFVSKGSTANLTFVSENIN